MQIYADADLPNVMNYHPTQPTLPALPALPFWFIVNKTKHPSEWRLELNCALMFFKPSQVKIRHKCSGAATETDIIIRAESRKSIHLLQVCQFFPFPYPWVVLALTVWHIFVSVAYKTMYFFVAMYIFVSFFCILVWVSQCITNSPIKVLIWIGILSS